MTTELVSVTARTLERAESLLKRKKYRKALTYFEDMIAGEPGHPQARLGAAACAIGLRDFQRGLEMLSRLDPIEDRDLRARRVRTEAWALLLQKKFAELLTWLDNQLPDLPEANRGRALLYKVAALAELRRRSEAAETLRLAWSLDNFIRDDFLMIAHNALLLNETEVARATCRSLMRTRYAVGAALLWMPVSLLGSDRILVWTPTALLLTLGAPLVFGILPVLAAWGIFAGISIIIGLTHRMPFLAAYSLCLAVALGGMSGLLALLLHPTLGGWAAGGILLAALVIAGFLIVRSNRRYRKRLSQPEDSVAPPATVASASLPGPASTATTQLPPGTATSPRSRLIYLIWPATVLLIGVALCRSVERPVGDPDERIRAVSDGIDPARIAYSHIELGIDDVRIGLLVIDLAANKPGNTSTEFTARLINRGDYPVQDSRVYLRPWTGEGQIVEVLLMEGSAGLIPPGDEVSLRASFDPRTRSPRILEETLTFPGDNTFHFTNSLNPRESPSLLLWVSEHARWITYSAETTHPDTTWEGVDVELVVGDVVGGSEG